MKVMTDNRADLDPSSWDPALDAVIAAPKHHKVLFENERLRVLEVTLEQTTKNPSTIIGGRRFLSSTRFRDQCMISLRTVHSCLRTGMS
jgi:hypothetical protein